MNENEKHLQIMGAIAKIDVRLSVVETELRGIKEKVAFQNGRVADGEAAIRKIVGEDNYLKGTRNATKYIIGLVLTILAIVAAWFGFKH